MSEKLFAVSGQHYLFNVQTFASIVLSNGGDAYEYAFRDRTTQGVIDDVANGASEIGVLVETTRTADDLEAAFAAADGNLMSSLSGNAPPVAVPVSFSVALPETSSRLPATFSLPPEASSNVSPSDSEYVAAKAANGMFAAAAIARTADAIFFSRLSIMLSVLSFTCCIIA